MKSRWIWIIVIAIVAIGSYALIRIRRHPIGSLKTAYWYWQSPFTLSQNELHDLDELGVKQIFVRAGTFSSDGQNLSLIIPQQYGEGAGQLPIHLVFNADGGVLRHFDDYDLARISDQIGSRIVGQVETAHKAGAKVIGVQLDFDIPTRLLPKYAELVHRIRQRYPQLKRQKGFYFSLSGLMSWLGTRGVEKLSSEVDFMVPQAYEGQTGTSPDTMRPVFDPKDTEQRLPKAERLNCPYWIGIPAYGHAFLFDDHNHLVATYRGLEAQDALRHPSFRLIAAYPSDAEGKPAKSKAEWIGEEILKLKAVQSAANGEGLGYTLAYSLPSPVVTQLAQDLVDQTRGANCQGVIIYRMPEVGSSFTVPLDSILRTRRHQTLEPKLDVKVTSSQDTLEAVESARKDIPIDLYVEATNIGSGSSFVSPDAVEITLQIDKPGVGDIRLRNFDRVEYGFGLKQEKEVNSQPERANILHLFKAFTYPGEKIYCGPIRLLNSGKVRVTIRSRIRNQSGFTYQETHHPEALIRNGTGELP